MDISSQSAWEKRVNALLIGLDGAVFQGDSIVPGVDRWISDLRESGFPHLFLTNTSTYPRSEIVNKLGRHGIHVQPQEILTPAVACAQWLCEHSIEKLALQIPRETAEDLVGFEVVPLSGGDKPDAILVGDLGENWNYLKLNNIFRAMMEMPQPRLVALGMTRYRKSENGLNMDVAPFVRAIEYASGCTADVIGKPSETFFHEALNILNVDASECVMIGDDIYSDIKGAQDAGLKGFLVKTGKFRESDLESGIMPDEIYDSILKIDCFR